MKPVQVRNFTIHEADSRRRSFPNLVAFWLQLQVRAFLYGRLKWAA